MTSMKPAQLGSAFLTALVIADCKRSRDTECQTVSSDAKSNESYRGKPPIAQNLGSEQEDERPAGELAGSVAIDFLPLSARANGPR
jgi:hypothetical protein